MAGTITTVVKAIFQSEGADKVAADIRKVGQAGEEISKKQTRLGNESTNTGRAFASQASGLGGLVAAYAGAAATIFALQQAFAALKSVAEFEQIISGTRDLAASLGQSGNKIIDNIKIITKGQLSLKESATVANLALSSGFNTDQISKLTLVANNASKVLGRDLTDSFTRLVRGAAKLEPELLDELGIFTRIEPAVAAYASKIGRSAGSLTEAERRQAFLNAVIEEGTRKFGAIGSITETSAEKFNRLAATLTDLGYRLGGFVTDILAPIADFFANNLGNSLALFLGILAITLSKGKSLLTQFFTDTSKSIADYGSTIAKRVAGPGLDQALGVLSKKFEDVSLVGFSKTEKAYIKAIRENTLAPQQISAAVEALSGFESRKAGLAEPANEKAKARQAAQIVAVKEALKDLPAIQDAAGNAAVRTGKAFELLSLGVSRLSSALGVALSRFNLFVAALSAIQLVGQVVFGVDILGKISDFFMKLREGSNEAIVGIESLVAAANKEVTLKLGFQVKRQDLEKANQQVAEFARIAITGGGTTFGEVFGQAIKRPLDFFRDFIRTQAGGDFLERTFGGVTGAQQLTRNLKEQKQLLVDTIDNPDVKKAAEELFNNFIAFQVENSISPAMFRGILAGAQKAGGKVEDYFKTLKLTPELAYLPQLTEEGKALFAAGPGGLTIDLEDDKLAEIASNALLATATIQTFQEDYARTAMTASQAGEKNVAIINRILEIEKLINIEKVKALTNGDTETTSRLNLLEIGLRELNNQKQIVNTITEQLVKREALVKFLEKAFNTERAIGQDLQFSGIIKDGKLAETELEQYTNRLGLYRTVLEDTASRTKEFSDKAKDLTTQVNEQTTAYKQAEEKLKEYNKKVEEFTKITPGVGTFFPETGGAGTTPTTPPPNPNIDLGKLRGDLGKLGLERDAALKALNDELTTFKNRYAEVVGTIAKQSLEASNLLRTEERRTIELKNQETILNLQISIQKEQNKLSLLQAQGEARQRSGQAQIRVGETQLNLLKQRDQSERLRLEILSKQQDRQESFNNALLKERSLIAEINQDRVKNIKDIELAQLSLRQTVGEALPGIGSQSDRISVDAQIALKTAELDLSNLATRRKILEDEAQTNKDNLDGRISVAQEEYDTALLRTLSSGNLEQQLKKEEELIKQRRKLEDDKLANESAIISQQTEIARGQAVLSRVQATLEGERRSFDLDQIDKQITLYETQKTIFDEFIKNYKEENTRLARIMNVPGAIPTSQEQQQDEQRADTLARTFADRISRLRSTQTENRALSENIVTRQRDIAALIFQGIEEANSARLGGINAEIESLKRLRAVEDQIRELEVQDRRNEAEEAKKAAEDRLNLLKKERTQINNELLKNRLGLLGEENSIQAQLARSLVQAQIKASAFVRAINDISLGIQNNLDTAVRDFFKTINEGTKTSIALSQTLKKLAVSSLETVQQSLAKAFITQPLQEAVGGFFEGLLGGLGYVTPRNADTVLSNVYDPTLKALRTTQSAIGQVVPNVFGEFGKNIGSAIGSGAKSLFEPIAGLFGTSSGPTILPTGSMPAVQPPFAIGGPVRHMAAGGYAGLRDRVPALLEPGEFVLRRPAAMAIGGDTLNQMNATGQTGPGNVTVNVSNQGTPQEVIGTPKISMNGRNMIVDIVVKDIQNNGPIRKTLRGGM